MTYQTASEQQAAKMAAALADDSVVFGGRVRTSTMHLIAGAAKAVKGSTTSICGKSVSNTYLPPSAGEKICSYCQKGRRATGFTSKNQPRTCDDCGKTFADNATRDNGDNLCGACWDKAGYENSHLDGEHRNAPEQDCPSCQKEQAAKEEASASAPSQEELAVAHDAGQHVEDEDLRCVACQQASDEAEEASFAAEAEIQAREDARYETFHATQAVAHQAAHENGTVTEVRSDCPSCQETMKGATVADPLDQPPAPTVTAEQMASVKLLRRNLKIHGAEERVRERIASIAGRLRDMAERVESQQVAILLERGEDDTFQPTDVATHLLADLMSLMTNASVQELVRDAARLERARREAR